MAFAFIAAGLVVLVIGGELIVRGAVRAASLLGMSPLLIGLTLVGFGTSTPELLTSLVAAFQDSPGIAVGNVIGSNIANSLLILGVAAMISPMAVQPAAFQRDGIALAGSSLACALAVWLGFLDRLTGIAFVALLVGYIVWAWRHERQGRNAEAERQQQIASNVPAGAQGLPAALVLAGLGIGLTMLGAKLLVDGAIDLARGWGVSETVIGLSIVAIGTSLPELVASIIAALRRQGGVALGNVIGSNIYNILGILGVTAAAHPIAIPPEIAHLDIWVLLAVTLVLLLFLRSGWTLQRWEGAVFLGSYACYVGYLALYA
jgi:cation:H+ antiporter